MGTFEWLGSRGADGVLRSTLATTQFELESLRPYVRAADPGARLAGLLSGAVAYETTGEDTLRLDVDFIVKKVRTSLLPEEATQYGLIEADRANARVILDVIPGELRLVRAELASGALDALMEGTIALPLRDDSSARLAVSFHDVALTRLLERVGWLPDVPAETEGGAERKAPIEAGRLVMLTARGNAPLSGWRGFLGGQTPHLPKGLAVDAQIVDGRLRVGESRPSRRAERTSHLEWRCGHALGRSRESQRQPPPASRRDRRRNLEPVRHLPGATRVAFGWAPPARPATALGFLRGRRRRRRSVDECLAADRAARAPDVSLAPLRSLDLHRTHPRWRPHHGDARPLGRCAHPR